MRSSNKIPTWQIADRSCNKGISAQLLSAVMSQKHFSPSPPLLSRGSSTQMAQINKTAWLCLGDIVASKQTCFLPFKWIFIDNSQGKRLCFFAVLAMLRLHFLRSDCSVCTHQSRALPFNYKICTYKLWVEIGNRHFLKPLVCAQFKVGSTGRPTWAILSTSQLKLPPAVLYLYLDTSSCEVGADRLLINATLFTAAPATSCFETQQ